MTKLTREEFISDYKRRARMSDAQIAAAALVAVPCDCAAPSCPGWYMASAIALMAFGLTDIPRKYHREIVEAAREYTKKRGA
jgi:hypothetical protein